jgi:hypothetical protein
VVKPWASAHRLLKSKQHGAAPLHALIYDRGQEVPGIRVSGHALSRFPNEPVLPNEKAKANTRSAPRNKTEQFPNTLRQMPCRKRKFGDCSAIFFDAGTSAL